jgi:prolyl 4-hydroxylase
MFLYRKEGALSPQLCNSFIETFEISDEKKPGVLYGPNGTSSTDSKKSTDITFHPGYLQHDTWGPLLSELIGTLQKGKEDYIQRHSIAMSKLDPFDISSTFNMQRYNPGEGFFGWHCERASLPYGNRVLVWMVYLNDMTDRGETEFLYQHHFEEPKQGKLVIWPSDWMYTHRGVSSPTQTKYILTGWFNMLERPKK